MFFVFCFFLGFYVLKMILLDVFLIPELCF